MSDLYTDFLKYRDDQGLNQNTTDNGKGVTSQNGTLFTMQYLICLLNSNQPDSVKWAETYRIADVFADLQNAPGLSIRFHGSTEFESMDNTCALLAFSGLHDDGVYANEMYDYGSSTRVVGIDTTQDAEKNTKFWPLARIWNFGFKPKWVFNNQNPDLFCNQGWYGRSPAMIGLIKMAGGKHWVNPFNWISVVVGQFLGCTADPGNTDARTLSYVNWQFLKERSWLWGLLYKIWCWQLCRVYPNGIKDVYTRYFGAEHPLSKYSDKY